MNTPLRTWLITAALLSAPSASWAAVDVFLCITNVTGTCNYNGGSGYNANTFSTDGWVRVAAVSLGISNVPPPNAPHGPGTATRRPTQITRVVDATSAVLAMSGLQGGVLPSVKLAWRRAGGMATTAPYSVLVMTNARVVRLQTSGSSGAESVETLVLDAESNQLTYWVQNAQGALGTPETTSWSGGVP